MHWNRRDGFCERVGPRYGFVAFEFAGFRIQPDFDRVANRRIRNSMCCRGQQKQCGRDNVAPADDQTVSAASWSSLCARSRGGTRFGRAVNALMTTLNIHTAPAMTIGVIHTCDPARLKAYQENPDLKLAKYNLTVNNGRDRTDVLNFVHRHAQIISIQNQHVSA